MSDPRELRNARLARAVLVIAAGGAFVGVTQRVPEVSGGLTAQVLLGVGGLFIAGGLIAAAWALFKRGDEDR